MTVVRYSLLAVAIVCLGRYGYAYLERSMYQAYEGREFDRRPIGEANASLVVAGGFAPDGAAARESTSRPRLSTTLIGRLAIPRLHLSAMVREGIDRRTLDLAIGHIPATALPGEAGNVGVAGHRDTFFRGLKDVRTRDQIRFSTANGDFKYEVESLLVVGPDELAVLAPSSDNVLTLVTCYPFDYIGSAPRRFIVRARQVSPQTAPPAIVE